MSALGQRQHGHRQGLQRLHEAEAGGLIEAQHVAGHLPAVAGGQGHLVGFGDQVVDRQDQPILADQDAVADPVGAEHARGEGVGRHAGV